MRVRKSIQVGKRYLPILFSMLIQFTATANLNIGVLNTQPINNTTCFAIHTNQLKLKNHRNFRVQIISNTTV